MATNADVLAWFKSNPGATDAQIAAAANAAGVTAAQLSAVTGVDVMQVIARANATGVPISTGLSNLALMAKENPATVIQTWSQTGTLSSDAVFQPVLTPPKVNVNPVLTTPKVDVNPVYPVQPVITIDQVKNLFSPAIPAVNSPVLPVVNSPVLPVVNSPVLPVVNSPDAQKNIITLAALAAIAFKLGLFA